MVQLGSFGSFFSTQIYCILLYLTINIMQSRRGWAQIEDDRLLKIIKKYGTKNWSLVSDKLSIGTTFERTGKQCRERWHNHLNPAINNEDWTREEDEKLFEAHRTMGSKWKQISKLFSGRTDNSIKNHFYSTVRKCLRTISKVKGQTNSAITMKSIKPSVLSKIVENVELIALLMELNTKKQRDSHNLNISEGVVNRISDQLKAICLQYQSKNKQNSELISRKDQPGSSGSASSFNSLPPPFQGNLEHLPLKVEHEKHAFQPQECPMKQIFEEFDSHHNQRSEFIETHIETKEKQQTNFRDIFLFPANHHPQEQKEEFSNRCHNIESFANEESGIFEECESNFFVSPSCNKKFLPALRLIAKVSRNSHNSHASPSYSSRPEDLPLMTVSRQAIYHDDQIQISFDPRDLMTEDMMQKQINDLE